MLSDWLSRVFSAADFKSTIDNGEDVGEFGTEIDNNIVIAAKKTLKTGEDGKVLLEGSIPSITSTDKTNDENEMRLKSIQISSKIESKNYNLIDDETKADRYASISQVNGNSRSASVLDKTSSPEGLRSAAVPHSHSFNVRTSLLNSKKNFFSSFFAKSNAVDEEESSERNEQQQLEEKSSNHESDDNEEVNLFTDPSHIENNRKPVLDDFSMIRVLGKGSYGKVVLVRKKDTQVLYAMKVLKKIDVVRKRQVERTKIERRVLGCVDHPFLMKLHFAFQTGNKLYLVLDYCPGGELFFHLSRYKRFPEGVVRFYSAELVLALKHLHESGVIYRDIKPENILLDAEGHVKLGDFGLAKDNITEAAFGAFSVCGTPEYMAPEVINKDGHGTSVDWWGLGMLMYEMLTGLPPWYTKDRQKLFERLRGAPLVFPKTISPVSTSIISGLLDRNPLRRLGAKGGQEVMDHDFFYGLDWDGLLRYVHCTSSILLLPRTPIFEGHGQTSIPFFSKRIPAPLNPCRNFSSSSESTHNFDPQFTRLPIDTINQVDGSSAPSLGNELNFEGFTYNDPCALYIADANAMHA